MGLFVLLTKFSFRNSAFWQLLLYWFLDNWPDLLTTPSQCTLWDHLPVICLNTICSWQKFTFEYLTKQVMGKKNLPGANDVSIPCFCTPLPFSSQHFRKLALFRQILLPQDLSFEEEYQYLPKQAVRMVLAFKKMLSGKLEQCVKPSPTS